MYKDHVISVVIPAYNEELLIGETLDGLPDYIDHVFPVNDGSKDRTLEILNTYADKDQRIHVIDNDGNQGLGQSLINGYLASAADDTIDITVIMAGDNQMHPDDLPTLLDRIIDEDFAYVKGNRLLHQDVYTMPRYRFYGNAILTILTKFATGYYSLMDPQCGYTAIKNSVLRLIPIERMTRGYGYNADILCMLNIQGFRVADASVKPVYDREKSKIKLWKYVPKTSWLLIRLFFRRLWQRYIIKDFHPLVLFYLFAFFNIIFIIFPFSIRFIVLYFFVENLVPQTTFIILIFTILITFQSILFAIWMDMDYNRIK